MEARRAKKEKNMLKPKPRSKEDMMNLNSNPNPSTNPNENRNTNSNKTWDDAVNRWLIETRHKKTQDDDMTKISWFNRYFSGLPLTEITRERMDQVMFIKEKQGRTPATINRYLALVRAILNKAHQEWYWMDKPPRLRMRIEDNRRIRFLTKPEASRLIEQLPDHLAAMVRFSLHTGLRQSNVTGLQWEQVHLENRLAYIHPDQSKNGSAIGVPLNREAMKLLEQQKGKHPEYVFVYRGKPLARPITGTWYAALKQAGVVQALAFTGILTRVGQFAGALLAGGLIEGFGYGLCFGLLAGVHLVSALVFGRMKAVSQHRQSHGLSLWQGVGEFMRELRHNPNLAVIFGVSVAVEIFGFSYLTVLPELAVSRLDMGAGGLSVLHAAKALGGLAGSVALTRPVWIQRPGRGYLLAVMLFGLALIGLSLATGLAAVLLAVAAVAVIASACDIFAQSLGQLVVSDHLRGRASGVWVIAVGIGPAGHVQVGVLASAFGIGAAVAVNGLLLLGAGAVVLYTAKRLVRL